MKNSTILWTSLEASVITGGQANQEWQATGVSINAQEVRPGDLFFATREDNLDEVFRKGACAAVVASPCPDHPNLPLLKVANVFDALQSLGRAARFKTHSYVVSAQGQAARAVIARALARAFDFYRGARHMSLGLAAMPENCEFALFGFSPLVRPDIAVIMDCANVESSVFESMPASGRVLVHANGDYINVIVKARAAGIRNIFTFGVDADCDAMMIETLHAGNGARARLKILSEPLDIILPPGEFLNPEMLAAALILKLSEVPLHRIAQILGGQADAKNIQGNNLALIDTVRHPVQTAFRVMNMIDLGRGRRTAVLEIVPGASDRLISVSNKDFDIPRKIDSLDLLYACKGLRLFSNVENAIRGAKPAASLEHITLQALAPGDFVTFKGDLSRGVYNAPQGFHSSALRLNPMKPKPANNGADETEKADYAL